MNNSNLQKVASQSLKNQKTEVTTLSVIKRLLNMQEMQQRFGQVLKDNAPTFLESIISTVASNTNFEGIPPQSIIASALQAATLNLPINPNLGFAYIIPYRGRTMKAQFQMGYKGYIQLAIRTGVYRTINVAVVHEGELIRNDRFTGDVILDEAEKKSDKIIGFYAFFRLQSGFEKPYYMSLDEVKAHAQRYSKSFNDKNGSWQTNFNGMALKTVVKLLLSKWGILSVQLNKAIEADQATIDMNGDGLEYDYIDNDNSIINPEDEGKNDLPFDDIPQSPHGHTEEPKAKKKSKGKAGISKGGNKTAIDSENDINNLQNPAYFTDFIKNSENIDVLDSFYIHNQQNIQMFEPKIAENITLKYLERIQQLKGNESQPFDPPERSGK